MVLRNLEGSEILSVRMNLRCHLRSWAPAGLAFQTGSRFVKRRRTSHHRKSWITSPNRDWRTCKNNPVWNTALMVSCFQKSDCWFFRWQVGRFFRSFLTLAQIIFRLPRKGVSLGIRSCDLDEWNITVLMTGPDRRTAKKIISLLARKYRSKAI